MEGIDISIDKLTQSVIDATTGMSKATRMTAWRSDDSPGHLMREWRFDWSMEVESDRQVAALTVQGDEMIQGLLSFTVEADHLLIHLVESAPHNVGRNKRYVGVAGNLFAFACLEARRRGFDGAVVFTAKTDLIGHYESTIGAIRLGASQRMMIEPQAAAQLIERYYQGSDSWSG